MPADEQLRTKTHAGWVMRGHMPAGRPLRNKTHDGAKLHNPISLSGRARNRSAFGAPPAFVKVAAWAVLTTALSAAFLVCLAVAGWASYLAQALVPWARHGGLWQLASRVAGSAVEWLVRSAPRPYASERAHFPCSLWAPRRLRKARRLCKNRRIRVEVASISARLRLLRAEAGARRERAARVNFRLRLLGGHRYPDGGDAIAPDPRLRRGSGGLMGSRITA